MRDGHSLRPARASTGVQHQRDIAGRRERCALSVSQVGPRCGQIRLSSMCQRIDRDLAFSRLARVRSAIRRAKQHARGRVLEEEAEFILPVSGIERSGRARDGGGQETDDGRQSVREHGRDAVAGPDPRRGQVVGHSHDLLAKTLIIDVDSGLGQNHGRLIIGRFMQQFEKGVYTRHDGRVVNRRW